MPERIFGVVGKSLKHSFSPKYFSEKFAEESIENCSYQAFEVRSADEIIDLFNNSELEGVNVTIPYKEEVIPLLDSIDESAEKIGAVNVIKKTRTGLSGFNSDYFGFKNSLVDWLALDFNKNALILGTGGASKAVSSVLKDLEISHSFVSREIQKEGLTYEELPNIDLSEYRLVINTTPLGTFPDTNSCPPIPYENLAQGGYFYDLVYNPSETLFMKKALEFGAKVKNGYEMLVLQAEKSWEIWNS